MGNFNAALFYVTLGLDPRVYFSGIPGLDPGTCPIGRRDGAWAPIEAVARSKPGHDASS